MENTIKIIVSGTKGGAQTLCTNFDKTEHDVIAHQTASDYRKYFLIEIPGTKIWGITFTELYKVYIAYYSLFEPGGTRTGGYVAINVYIPHEKVCADSFALVNNLLNRYLERYVDNITKQMSPKNVVIDDFKDLLHAESLTTPVRIHRYVSNSGSSGLHTVNTENEIAEIFKDPYRPELKNWEKVFFIEKRLHENPAISRSINNLQIIDPLKINELEKGLRLRSKYKIKKLQVNGNEISDESIKQDNLGYYHDGLFAGDQYQVTLSRQYYNDLPLRGEVSGNTTMPKEIQLESLYPPVSWKPNQVSIAIETSPAKPPCFLLRIGGKEFRGESSIMVDEILVADPFTLEAIESLSDSKGQVLFQGRSIDNKKISILDLNQIEFAAKGIQAYERLKININNAYFDLPPNKKLIVYYLGKVEPNFILSEGFISQQTNMGQYIVSRRHTIEDKLTQGYTNINKHTKQQNKFYNEKQQDVNQHHEFELDRKKIKLVIMAIFTFLALAGGLFLGKKIFNKDKSKIEDSNQSGTVASDNTATQEINWKDSVIILNQELDKLRSENEKLIEENEKLKKPAPATANQGGNTLKTPGGNSQIGPGGNDQVNKEDIGALTFEQLVRKYYAKSTSTDTKTEIAIKIQKVRGLKDLQAAYTLIENQKRALELDD